MSTALSMPDDTDATWEQFIWLQLHKGTVEERKRLADCKPFDVMLLKDPHEQVRIELVLRHKFLGILSTDESNLVRLEVARTGFKPHHMMLDTDPQVRHEAQRWLDKQKGESNV